MDLFVYGTLRDHDMMAAVAGEGPLKPDVARLPNLQVRPLNGTPVPFIEVGPGAAKGVVWSDLNETQVARIDLYEGAFDYTRTPVVVIVNGEEHMAEMYMPPKNSEAGPGDWFLHDWQRNNKKASVLTAEEIFSQTPLPTAAELRVKWPMIDMRSWAKVRAREKHPVAQIRHVPTKEDVKILKRHNAHGDFFRLQAFDVDYLRFDGKRSGRLQREVFLGIDASLVLPYDPKRDIVLLVEQMRMGPAARADRNPWVLEPVAGMLDPGETPEQAALRETQEEAGLKDVQLEKISSFYPSPGSSTDFFHAFIGICDIPDTGSYTGGLISEAEDLRLHPLPFEDALSLARKGEITAGPLMMMLYWLALHREDLRAG